MRSGYRLAERRFGLVVRVVAPAFADFLIGRGSLVVGDLAQVEHRYTALPPLRISTMPLRGHGRRCAASA